MVSTNHETCETLDTSGRAPLHVSYRNLRLDGHGWHDMRLLVGMCGQQHRVFGCNCRRSQPL
jgi:hypothetical protein